MNSCLKMKRKAEEETPFMKNGRLLLEELIAFCNGKSNPIRVFSADDLRRATNNYDQSQRFFDSVDFDFYKGSLEDRLVTVKKYDKKSRFELEHIIKDIVVGSQMSVHQNVQKLIGCCLETKKPTLVYEFVGERNLFKCIRIPSTEAERNDFKPLPWICRLRIAMGISNAIAYLHTSFSRPVIHRNVKPHTVILDENNVAKLIDFSLSISIPEGQLHVESEMCGTKGYVAPEYLHTRYITEKIDVYGFGMFLLSLLAGRGLVLDGDQYDNEAFYLPYWLRSCVEQNQIIKAVDKAILEEGIDHKQFQDFAELVLRCISETAEDRPTMIDVGKQLRRIYESVSTSFSLAN